MPECWTVPPEGAALRLDRFVAARCGRARNQVQHWIRDRRVTVNGQPATRPSLALAAGDEVGCTPPEAVEERVRPEPGELALLYQDPQLLVLDKPAGLTVHPGAGQATGTLVHRLLDRFPELAGVGGPGRPGIVHRLDKGTSGVMVVARTAESYAALVAAFAARRIVKEYLAVVYGVPRQSAGRIEAAIGRHPQRRQEMAIRPGGRPAVTGYRCRAAAGGLALLALNLETGRTHQIRVHLKGLGHPLVGDPVYGERRWQGLHGPARLACRDFARPALHAWQLQLAHPTSGQPLHFTAAVPADLRQLWWQATGAPWPEL